ncbi:unnamed protein product [Mycena citricolor]|uniref:Uncharacterized protein n=1 Tax=Mycena citricolor TaxID=2018698 RepID=A0AAD2H9R1_9AGAR|nr:unnamed protein product [Mycena citricolor]
MPSDLNVFADVDPGHVELSSIIESMKLLRLRAIALCQRGEIWNAEDTWMGNPEMISFLSDVVRWLPGQAEECSIARTAIAANLGLTTARNARDDYVRSRPAPPGTLDPSCLFQGSTPEPQTLTTHKRTWQETHHDDDDMDGDPRGFLDSPTKATILSTPGSGEPNAVFHSRPALSPDETLDMPPFVHQLLTPAFMDGVMLSSDGNITTFPLLDPHPALILSQPPVPPMSSHRVDRTPGMSGLSPSSRTLWIQRQRRQAQMQPPPIEPSSPTPGPMTARRRRAIAAAAAAAANPAAQPSAPVFDPRAIAASRGPRRLG